MTKKELNKLLPLSETSFYILLCLRKEAHGYAIMQQVKELTEGRIPLGPGTVYGSLGKMEKDGLIRVVTEEKRRKVYTLTESGRTLLGLEIRRLGELVANAGDQGREKR